MFNAATFCSSPKSRASGLCKQFVFCTYNDGYDTCKNCPSGKYTKDTIKTSEWFEHIDICVTKPTCAEIDTTWINGECLCNKFNGYYGNDINNCQLDTKHCKEAGYELDNDGNCVECEKEYYKPENDGYGVCRVKTRCTRHQVEAHPGSSKADRKCRPRTAKDGPPPTPPPTTDQTDHGANGTRLGGDGDGLHHMYIWLIGVILSSLLILSVSAILIYVFRKKWCCATFIKMFKVGRRYTPVPPVENGSDRGHSVTRNSREEDHELTSITNIDSSLDSSKSSSNSSKDHEATCAKYRITEVIVEMDENETGVKTLALEPKGDEETVVKSLSDELDAGQTNQAADLDSTSLKTRYDEKGQDKGQGELDSELTDVKQLSCEDLLMSATPSDDALDSITKVKKHLPADDKDLSITKVKRMNENESRARSGSRTPKSYHKMRGYLDKSKKGYSVDLNWLKFRKKNTQETSFSLPTTPKKSNLFGATSKESDRPTLKVEPFSRRSSPRNSQLESGNEMASAGADDSFRTVPSGISFPMFSDSIGMSHPLFSDSAGMSHPMFSDSAGMSHPMFSDSTGMSHPMFSDSAGMSHPMFSDSAGMSHPLFSDSTGFYSCDDEGITADPLNASQQQHHQRRNNRATLPPNVFIVEGDLDNGKDSNGRVRSLPIISQESQEDLENGNVTYWQQLALHGLETGARPKDEGHNIIHPSVHLSQRQNAITYTSQSNEEVHTSIGRAEGNDGIQVPVECAVIETGEQISFDPLSTLDANSIMNETQESITPSNPLISIPRPHEVLPPPEPVFDETMVAGPSSGSSEEAISEGGASEGATSEGAVSEGSAASVVMPLLERKEEGSSSTGSGSSRKRTLSRSLSMEEENKDSSSSTEKSMG
ncbi:uncharacterized protein LOC134692498 [Mytilus trossulus]|uniref:uncharacterized protein LOC134692498 n=1 Tax=Mytilus trossulus TaxID=6551 RepID=UPI003004E7CE